MIQIQLLRRLEVVRINGHHLNRRSIARFRRYEDHGGHATIDRKRQFLDLLFVRHDSIVARRQNSVDTFQLERMAEYDGSVGLSRGHRANSRRELRDSLCSRIGDEFLCYHISPHLF